MLEKNIKDKIFEEVKGIILEVASIHNMTLHNIYRSKKENLSNSDFLRVLEEKIDLTDYQN